MPIVTPFDKNPAIDGRQSDMAMEVRRGILSGMQESDLVFIPEFALPGGRRADLIGIDAKGMITIVEIKSSIADFKADNKWHEYRDYSDRFYFATHQEVPRGIFPESEGLIIADAFGCAIIRESETDRLAAATRKSLTIKIARAAALRLQTISDYAATKN
ncbi:MAG: MmcB family DNA repair protein [Pseudomonadota bacterium]